MLNREHRGSALIGLLFSVIIIMLATAMFWGQKGANGKPAAVQYLDDGKAAGCMMIRQTLATQIQAMQMTNPGQPPTMERLSAMTMGNTKCPGNGSYTITPDGKILCNIHK